MGWKNYLVLLCILALLMEIIKYISNGWTQTFNVLIPILGIILGSIILLKIRRYRNEQRILKEQYQFEQKVKNATIGKRKIEEQKLKLLKPTLRRMANQGDYKIVVGFVAQGRTDLYALNELLEYTGYKFSMEELKLIVEAEGKRSEKETFKSKVTCGGPLTLKDFVSNLVKANEDGIYRKLSFEVKSIEVGGFWLDPEIELKNEVARFEKWQKSADKRMWFENELSQAGLKIDKSEISKTISKIKKEMRLTNFQSQLLDNDIMPVDIHSMSGYEFEKFLAKLFLAMGFSVEETPLSQDQGADLVISKLGERTVVQAKQYSDSVGNKAVQEVVASIKHYGATHGMVVTTSYFTKSAEELAASNRIELIDGAALQKLIGTYL